jgi:non-heme Fe2+,alpha-ketoglutarate-dependent halogenase
MRMSKLLSAEAVESYRRNGYWFPLDILTPEAAAGYRRRLEAFERGNGGPIGGALRHKSHLVFTWLNELVRHPRILDGVEDVIGPNILCWSSSFFIKEATDPSYVSWHQDATYWGLDKPDVVTAWIAFTPANLVNGCMKFAPGSHREQLVHRDTFDKHNLLTRGQEIAVEVDETKAVCVELAPGQASLHHVLLAHGSAPNRSGDRRIGYAIRYIPTCLRQIAGQQDSATLVRGRDEHGHFELEPAPEADLAPAALALHAAITERQQKVLYRGTGVEQYRS